MTPIRLAKPSAPWHVSGNARSAAPRDEVSHFPSAEMARRYGRTPMAAERQVPLGSRPRKRVRLRPFPSQNGKTLGLTTAQLGSEEAGGKFGKRTSVWMTPFVGPIRALRLLERRDGKGAAVHFDLV